MFTTNPENERIVSRLVDLLSQVPMDGTVDYSKLSSVARKDVQRDFRYLLDRARDICEENLGCLFECVRTIGIRRLPASEAYEVGLNVLRGVRRKARRGSKRTRRVNSNSLSRSEQQRVTAVSSHLGAIALMADGNKTRTIAAVVEPGRPIPPEDILRMFVK